MIKSKFPSKKFCFILFAVIITVNTAIRRLLPCGEWSDGNLLINVVGSLLLTFVIVVIIWMVRLLLAWLRR